MYNLGISFQFASKELVDELLAFVASLDCSGTIETTEDPDELLACKYYIKEFGIKYGLTLTKADILALKSVTPCGSDGFDDEEALIILGLAGQDWIYDEQYWSNPELSFPPQDLPSYQDFFNAFPKKANGGWLYGADNIYNLVGGKVLQAKILVL